MGACFSDVRGGKQAVGGTSQQNPNSNNNAALNDAVDFFFRSHGQQALFTQVELSLSASNLLDRDITSKSDPMVVLYAKKRDGKLEEVGRTEVILNNLNPIWIEKITTAYQFEMVQPLVFHIYDVDTSYHNKPVKSLKLKDQQFLGEANCVLSEIVTRQNRTLTIQLQNRNGRGMLRKLGTLTVHAEETIASKTAVDKLQKSVAELESLHREKNGANFIIPSRHGREKVLKGQLFVDQFLEKEQYSFLDYISSGFELNFMVAVDFTASNGNPHNPNSLHYIDPSGRLNSYQQAIMEVGQVIQFYDSDRRFPAWGFGGKTPSGTISHCFNLNGSASFEVEGVEGIMAAYATALRNVSLSGPTLFGQDGVITDMQETKDALVKASDLPLSILIVGVGGADFKQMEILDADNGCRLQSSTGRVATRDIVQFVPMREVNSGQISVVQALLEELPGQFLTYFRHWLLASYPVTSEQNMPGCLLDLEDVWIPNFHSGSGDKEDPSSTRYDKKQS
ncbi:unnamed protein product [Dovyalis caffra]|uniref:C2 domain-containing protein n=1 Tax=Dovyalis caffra TaxID=77055 RepID=A0AAV1RVW5_9ROSI|nr:unnamed protein product [Dovyalis caffra]